MNNELFRKIKNDGEVLGISPLYASAKQIIVGFSGGADSSLLLEYLAKLSGNTPDFPKIYALHVNHMIRGAEAERDEEFCRSRCGDLGIPLTVKRVNIPQMAADQGIGTEECARNARYEAFFEMARSFDGPTLIATAHNADDNFETVLFNLARGGGAAGLSGIPPVRDGNIIRPLLGVGSDEIRQACRELGIEYVTDSTNIHGEYTRNFIRRSVVPLLKEVNPAAVHAVLRSGISLREDEELLRGLAADAVSPYLSGTCSDFAEIPRHILGELPLAVMSRGIAAVVAAVTPIAMSADQIRQCRGMILRTGTGKISLPDGVTFEVSKRLVSVYRHRPSEDFSLPVDIPKGEELVHVPCEEAAFDLFLCRSKDVLSQNHENIYKLSIYSALRFDTIYGRVYARSRRAGDTLSLGGQTRRLKKMICDYGIPEGRRHRLPVIFDDAGVLIVPGLPERGESYARPEDYASGNVLYVMYCLR